MCTQHVTFNLLGNLKCRGLPQIQHLMVTLPRLQPLPGESWGRSHLFSLLFLRQQSVLEQPLLGSTTDSVNVKFSTRKSLKMSLTTDTPTGCEGNRDMAVVHAACWLIFSTARRSTLLTILQVSLSCVSLLVPSSYPLSILSFLHLICVVFLFPLAPSPVPIKCPILKKASFQTTTLS